MKVKRSALEYSQRSTSHQFEWPQGNLIILHHSILFHLFIYLGIYFAELIHEHSAF